ncbi:MAG: glycosyltransferase [Halioglobus sp.]|nr:glycosyltransferase [Halioglobus sp.]
MKILVLTSTFSRWEGDTEPRFVNNLSRHLAQEHDVQVLAPHAPGARTTEVLEGIPVHRFRYAPEALQTLAYGGGILPNLRERPLRFLLVPLFIAAQTLAILRLARVHQFDVIHAHWIIPQGFSAALARLLGLRVPVLLTSHGGDLFALKGRVLSALKRWISGRCQGLSVVSSAMRQRAADLELMALANIHNIPMGVDTAGEFQPPTEPTRREGILFVGRLVDKKGIEYLIEAMPGVLAEASAAHLTIVGDGPLAAELAARCRALGVEDAVTFTGAVANHDVPGYLQRAAVTVFPSIVTDSGDQEGTPVAIMEALACGCAAVVSDYPGARDIIVDGRTGLLVPQRSPEALARALLRLYQDPALCAALGAGGRKHVQAQYDWRVISDRFLDVFRDILEQRDNNGSTV